VKITFDALMTYKQRLAPSDGRRDGRSDAVAALECAIANFMQERKIDGYVYGNFSEPRFPAQLLGLVETKPANLTVVDGVTDEQMNAAVDTLLSECDTPEGNPLSPRQEAPEDGQLRRIKDRQVALYNPDGRHYLTVLGRRGASLVVGDSAGDYRYHSVTLADAYQKTGENRAEFSTWEVPAPLAPPAPEENDAA
jgi:hypothetical protein